jgi:hypothetical protein
MKQLNENQSELIRAEQAVDKSLQNFERAMADLEEKFDLTARRVKQTTARVTEPYQRLRELLRRGRGSVNQAWMRSQGWYEEARSGSAQAVEHVKANPRPYAYAAAGILSVIVAVALVSRRMRQTDALSPTRTQLSPEMEGTIFIQRVA